MVVVERGVERRVVVAGEEVGIRWGDGREVGQEEGQEIGGFDRGGLEGRDAKRVDQS